MDSHEAGVARFGGFKPYGEMKFAEKLTKLLAITGKSQSRLMRETGISQSAISEMTLGKRRPYMDQGHLLARALNVPLDYLADDAADEPPTAIDADEAAILMLYRALRIDRDEALRRLANEPASGHMIGVAQRDRTDLILGRERERNRRKGGSESDPVRQDDEADLPDKPRRGR